LIKLHKICTQHWKFTVLEVELDKAKLITVLLVTVGNPQYFEC